MARRPPRWPGSSLREQSGQALPLVAVCIIVLMATAGLVVDLGNAYRVHQQLQASADAAAAAGATNLPDTSAAVAAASAYSSAADGKNPIVGAGDVTASATTDCSTSAKFCNPANTVHVTQDADVPTTFLRVLGIDSIHETVKAQACSPCGAIPLDIMIVLDRTGSMSGSKLDSAKQGVMAFMKTMDPTIDNVGLAVLPPAASTSAACSKVPGNPYDSTTAAYLLVPLNGDYASSTGFLTPGSPLISTLNCVQAGGTTAYANALDAAQDELDKDGRDGTQKVIIILSDGAANTGPGYLPASSPYRTNPCRTADEIAAASKAKTVLMYSIGYDIGGAGAQACTSRDGKPESPAIKADDALEAIASPGNYYAQPDPSSLTNIFLAISADIAKGTSRING